MLNRKQNVQNHIIINNRVRASGSTGELVLGLVIQPGRSSVSTRRPVTRLETDGDHYI